VALAHEHVGRVGPARDAVGRPRRVGRARRAGGGVLPDEPAGERPLLPDLDDVRGRPCTAARRGARGAVRARAARPALRSRRRRTARPGCSRACR
jgi:hypothetical protein